MAQLRYDCAVEVKAFISEYPSPSIRLATTMIDGYANCIKPIKTICGAEIMCNPSTQAAVAHLIKQEGSGDD